MQGSALWKARWSSGSQDGSSGSEDFPLSYSFQVMIPSSVGCILGLILSLQEERTPTMGNGHILKPVSHYTHTHTHTHTPTPMQTAKSFSGSLSALVQFLMLLGWAYGGIFIPFWYPWYMVEAPWMKLEGVNNEEQEKQLVFFFFFLRTYKTPGIKLGIWHGLSYFDCWQ